MNRHASRPRQPAINLGRFRASDPLGVSVKRGRHSARVPPGRWPPVGCLSIGRTNGRS